ncbi:Fc.00g096290.m01.CDS01 [Cosmosporella sp. VM-42]
MCREFMGIAICAPVGRQLLQYNCGRLHLVAAKRQNCKFAYDKCVCYFGTCGHIDRDTAPVIIDLPDIDQVRCSDCTTMNSEVGIRRQGREILESPLLVKVPAPFSDAEACAKHISMLAELWGNESHCPYHETKMSDSTESTESTESPEPAGPSVRLHPAKGPTDMDWIRVSTSAVTTKVPKPEELLPYGATKKDEEHGPEAEQFLAMSLEMQPTADSAGQSPEETMDSVKPDVGLKTSHWAPGNPLQKTARPNIPAATPMNTAKVRDATRKISGARAFLNGSG